MSAPTPSHSSAVESAEPSPPEVLVLDQANCAAWDAFVFDAPDATFFHLSGWRRIIEEVCGHRTHYLYARRSGRIVGVLPLAEIKSRLFGHSLISTPFCVYGGAVAESALDREALERRACSLAEELRVDYLEMRNIHGGPGEWERKDLYVTFRKEISTDESENMSAIPRKQRAMVRKGIQAGLVSHIDPDVSRFYDMYSISVRNLGTPVLGKRYFSALRDEFPDSTEVMTITSADGEPVSSVLSFYFRDEVLPYYGGGTHAARDVKANDFMYWELMRRAVPRGVRVFDFGRSKLGTGSYRFKTHWGFEPEPLQYQYHLVKSETMPDLSPMNPRYRLMIAAWQRMPVWLSRIVGPMIARSLG